MPHNRTTESEMSEVVLRILAALPDGEATIDYIKKKIPEFTDLTAEDCAQSDTRPNEELWEQIVRNIVSHHDAEGNYISEGYLTSPSKGRLKITDSGRIRIS